MQLVVAILLFISTCYAADVTTPKEQQTQQPPLLQPQIFSAAFWPQAISSFLKPLQPLQFPSAVEAAKPAAGAAEQQKPAPFQFPLIQSVLGGKDLFQAFPQLQQKPSVVPQQAQQQAQQVPPVPAIPAKPAQLQMFQVPRFDVPLLLSQAQGSEIPIQILSPRPAYRPGAIADFTEVSVGPVRSNAQEAPSRPLTVLDRPTNPFVQPGTIVSTPKPFVFPAQPAAAAAPVNAAPVVEQPVVPSLPVVAPGVTTVKPDDQNDNAKATTAAINLMKPINFEWLQTIFPNMVAPQQQKTWSGMLPLLPVQQAKQQPALSVLQPLQPLKSLQSVTQPEASKQQLFNFIDVQQPVLQQASALKLPQVPQSAAASLSAALQQVPPAEQKPQRIASNWNSQNFHIDLFGDDFLAGKI